MVDAFVTAAGALDVARMDRLLDEAFAAQRFEAALEDVVFPTLRRVGEGWSEGSIDVSMEHAASETIRRRLVRFYESVASSPAPQVIVGLPPGCHHEIGALAFAIAARRAGLDDDLPRRRCPAGELARCRRDDSGAGGRGRGHRCIRRASGDGSGRRAAHIPETDSRRRWRAARPRSRRHGIGRAVRLDRRRGRCRSGAAVSELTADAARAVATPVVRDARHTVPHWVILGRVSVDRDLGGHMDFNSILIGSEDPARLVDYYTKLFGEPTMSDGGYTGWQLGIGLGHGRAARPGQGQERHPGADPLEHRDRRREGRLRQVQGRRRDRHRRAVRLRRGRSPARSRRSPTPTTTTSSS